MEPVCVHRNVCDHRRKHTRTVARVTVLVCSRNFAASTFVDLISAGVCSSRTFTGAVAMEDNYLVVIVAALQDPENGA